MDKIRNIEQYKDTIQENSDFFKKYYFHALIDLNLVKLDSILEYGILSKNLIEQKDVVSIYTHDSSFFDSKNGDTFVSLSEYTDKCSFNEMFSSFSLHTMSSLSLMINKQINIAKEGERETWFDDEIFCFQFIDKTKIEGIILPEHLSNLMINEVNCLPNDLYCFTKSYINHWLKCTEEYFRCQIPSTYITKLKTSHKQLWDILDEYEMPEKWVQSAIEIQRIQYGKDIKDVLAEILQVLWSKKLGMTNPSYIDVILQINKNRLPVYEIKKKCLKRIN